MSDVSRVSVTARAGGDVQARPQPTPALAANDNEVSLVIGIPEMTEDKLDLYDRFHHFQHSNVGWSDHGPKQRRRLCGIVRG